MKTSYLLIGMTAVVLGGAQAFAEEVAEVKAELPVRMERRYLLSAGAAGLFLTTSENPLVAPLADLRFEYELSDHISLGAALQSNGPTGRFTTLVLGGRFFLLDDGVSPYAYARAGLFYYRGLGDSTNPERTTATLEGGAGLEVALRGGFTWYLEGGVQVLPDYNDTTVKPTFGTGIGYRF
jgi:hypothetical protein